MAGLLAQNTRSPGLQVAAGHLGQLGVLRAAVARDRDPGLRVRVLGQPAAVEADDACVGIQAGARPVGAAAAPRVGQAEVAHGGVDGGLGGRRGAPGPAGVVVAGGRRRTGRRSGRPGRRRPHPAAARCADQAGSSRCAVANSAWSVSCWGDGGRLLAGGDLRGLGDRERRLGGGLQLVASATAVRATASAAGGRFLERP